MPPRLMGWDVSICLRGLLGYASDDQKNNPAQYTNPLVPLTTHHEILNERIPPVRQIPLRQGGRGNLPRFYPSGVIELRNKWR